MPPHDAPAGVTIRVVPAPTADYPRESIEIRNSSSTPLYLLGHAFLAEGNPAFHYEPLPLALPKGLGPTHKVMQNQTFRWDINWDSNVKPEVASEDRQPAWVAEADALLLHIFWDNRIESSSGYVTVFEPRNRSGAPRPATVQPPAPQTTEIFLVYGT